MVITDDGPVRIEVPRDREGSFEPQIIGKHERRFTGFDQKIAAMYARGMTVCEIQGYPNFPTGQSRTPGPPQRSDLSGSSRRNSSSRCRVAANPGQ